MFAHRFLRGKKGWLSPFLWMQTPVMIFYWGLLGEKRDWKITLSTFFFFFWLFVFLLFSLLPLYCLALPFSSYSSAKACRQKNCLTQRCQVNYSLFFVNSFPNQMLVHHILVIKQITSGAAEHRHKLCLVLPPNMRQTEMALVLLETVSAKPKPTNCVSLSLTFQALK